MASPDEPQGAGAPSGEIVHDPASQPPGIASDSPAHDGNSLYGDVMVNPPVTETRAVTAPPASPPKPPGPPEDEGDEDEGMARMSFLEHLEELRKRLLLAIGGMGVAFVLSLLFSD